MTALLAQLVLLAEKSPEPEDVVAGWTAFAVFLLLIAAVGLLGWSLTKHLRKAEANNQAGVFGSDPSAETDEVVSDAEDPGPASTEPKPHQAP